MKEILTGEMKRIGLEAGADIVGVASIAALIDVFPDNDPTRFMPDAQFIVVAGSADPPGISKIKDPMTYTKMALSSYLRADAAVHSMTSYLNKKGVNGSRIIEKAPIAMDAGKRLTGNIRINKAAVAAGLGATGRHTMLVTEKYGPRVRLAAFITNAGLEADSPLENTLCNECGACSAACPSGAISETEDFSTVKCLAYLATGLKSDELEDSLKNADAGAIQRQVKRFAKVTGGWLQSFASMRPLYYHCGNCIKVCKMSGK